MRILQMNELMDIKVLIGISIVVIGALVLSGCRAAEIVRYVHGPSKSFYEDMNIEDKNLEKFKDDGVLFVVDVKEIRQDQYLVWLGLYSDGQKTVIINDAQISGDGWEEINQINQELTLNVEVPEAGLVKGSIKIFQVGDDLLNQVVKGGSGIALDVNYSIGGIKRTMSFLLDRRVEKQTIFST